jgi:hypothetical protein
MRLKGFLWAAACQSPASSRRRLVTRHARWVCWCRSADDPPEPHDQATASRTSALIPPAQCDRCFPGHRRKGGQPADGSYARHPCVSVWSAWLKRILSSVTHGDQPMERPRVTAGRGASASRCPPDLALAPRGGHGVGRLDESRLKSLRTGREIRLTRWRSSAQSGGGSVLLRGRE